MLGDAPPPACSPEGGTQALLGSAVAENDVIKTMGETIACTDTPPTIIPPPPGFSQFSWPYEDWSVNDGQSLSTFTKDPPGCVPDIPEGRPVVVPSLPLSPIAPVSADASVTATMGSSRDESIFPSEVGVMVPPLGDVRSGPTADELRAVSPLPSVDGLLQDLLWAPVAPRSPDIVDRRAPCSADQVPRWRIGSGRPVSGRAVARYYSVPEVRFGIPHIGHRTTLRRRGSSVFPCIIHGSSSGLLFHSRLAFWKWGLDGG